MSTQQFVSFPPGVLDGGTKFEAINLLGSIARFALPGAFPGNAVERDLETRFSRMQSIGLPDAIAWLSEAGVKLTPLDAEIAAVGDGDTEKLHVALQQLNDAKGLQLLAVNDASKLIEMEDRGEQQLSPRPMCLHTQPCLLLRLNYNSEYGYYAASLPGDSRRPLMITWESVVEAGINAAVAIAAPPKPVDMERAAASLHIMSQALQTALAAHADASEALGQTAPTPIPVAQPAPALTEQAV